MKTLPGKYIVLTAESAIFADDYHVKHNPPMSDTMTPQQRHDCMSHIRAKNTRPEVAVRRYLHAEGFRFRIHVKKLPGCPDVVLAKYRTCIFVNGCFWHAHRGCRYATPLSPPLPTISAAMAHPTHRSRRRDASAMQSTAQCSRPPASATTPQ